MYEMYVTCMRCTQHVWDVRNMYEMYVTCMRCT